MGTQTIFCKEVFNLFRFKTRYFWSLSALLRIQLAKLSVNCVVGEVMPTGFSSSKMYFLQFCNFISACSIITHSSIDVYNNLHDLCDFILHKLFIYRLIVLDLLQALCRFFIASLLSFTNPVIYPKTVLMDTLGPNRLSPQS